MTDPSRDIAVRVAQRDTLTEGVIALTLQAVDGGPLPEWTPGAHIGVTLPITDPEGLPLVRQYYLCGDPGNRDSYQIGVLRETAGRGGSAYVHDSIQVGDRLTIYLPRNHFPFEPGQKTLFIASGIGITPMLPMVRQAIAEGRDWQMIVAVRNRARLAFANQLAQFYPARVRYHFDEHHGLLDLAALLSGRGAETTVYSCGPGGLLDALQARNTGAAWQLRIERFAASATAPVKAGGTGFDVICASNGARLHVPLTNPFSMCCGRRATRWPVRARMASAAPAKPGFCVACPIIATAC